MVQRFRLVRKVYHGRDLICQTSQGDNFRTVIIKVYSFALKVGSLSIKIFAKLAMKCSA